MIFGRKLEKQKHELGKKGPFLRVMTLLKTVDHPGGPTKYGLKTPTTQPTKYDLTASGL